MPQRPIQDAYEFGFLAGKTGGVPLREEAAAGPGRRVHAGGIDPIKNGLSSN
jgi:hypothetical protein